MPTELADTEATGLRHSAAYMGAKPSERMELESKELRYAELGDREAIELAVNEGAAVELDGGGSYGDEKPVRRL